MKKPIKVLAMGAIGVLGLTGCSLEEKNYIKEIESTITQKVLADDDITNSIADSATLTYNFTEYQITENSDKCDVCVYGKLSTNGGYNSYVKVNFNNVDESSIDTSNYYKSIYEIANSNINYSIENIQVESFENLDDCFKNVVPQREGVYNLKSTEVLKLDNFSYDQSNNKLSFTTDCVANYEYQATWIMDTGGAAVPITNYYYKNIKYDYNVSSKLSLEDYVVHEGDTKYFTSQFLSYIENGEKDKYSISETSSTVLNKTTPKNQKDSTEDMDL